MRIFLFSIALAAIVLTLAVLNHSPLEPIYSGLPSQTIVAKTKRDVADFVRTAETTLRRLDIPETEKPEQPWRQWCESPKRIPCKQAGSAECPDGPDGRQMVCVLPWWDDGRKQPVCSPKFPGRSQQRATQQRLRNLVAHVCRAPSWWERGMGLHPYCWRHKRGGSCKARCNPDALTAFLSTVALRESSWRPWKRHKLNPDVEAALAAWERRRDVFAGSPHYPDKARWSQGTGLYGMNPALFLDAWDPHAAPEVLCRLPEATLVALRRLRKAWHKYRAGVPCGDSAYHGGAIERSQDGSWSRPLPSWTDLHRAVWVGSLCPVGRDRLFERRARREGLDPSAPVTLEMLGEPVDRDAQDRAADELREIAGS